MCVCMCSFASISRLFSVSCWGVKYPCSCHQWSCPIFFSLCWIPCASSTKDRCIGASCPIANAARTPDTIALSVALASAFGLGSLFAEFWYAYPRLIQCRFGCIYRSSPERGTPDKRCGTAVHGWYMSCRTYVHIRECKRPYSYFHNIWDIARCRIPSACTRRLTARCSSTCIGTNYFFPHMQIAAMHHLFARDRYTHRCLLGRSRSAVVYR